MTHLSGARESARRARNVRFGSVAVPSNGRVETVSFGGGGGSRTDAVTTSTTPTTREVREAASPIVTETARVTTATIAPSPLAASQVLRPTLTPVTRTEEISRSFVSPRERLAASLTEPPPFITSARAAPIDDPEFTERRVTRGGRTVDEQNLFIGGAVTRTTGEAKAESGVGGDFLSPITRRIIPAFDTIKEPVSRVLQFQAEAQLKPFAVFGLSPFKQPERAKEIAGFKAQAETAFVGGAITRVRDRPVSVAVNLALLTAAGPVLAAGRFAGIRAAGAVPILQKAAPAAKLAGKAAGVGLIGAFVGTKAIEVATAPPGVQGKAAVVGGIAAGEVLPFVLGARLGARLGLTKTILARTELEKSIQLLPKSQQTGIRTFLRQAPKVAKSFVPEEPRIAAAERLTPKAAKVLIEILKADPRIIVGGSAILPKAAKVKPKDIDLITSGSPRELQKLIGKRFVEAGVQRVGSPSAGKPKITLSGAKAIEIAPISKLEANVRQVIPFTESVSASIVTAPSGIRVLRLRTQLQRAAVGGFIPDPKRGVTRPKDISRFLTVAEISFARSEAAIRKGPSLFQQERLAAVAAARGLIAGLELSVTRPKTGLFASKKGQIGIGGAIAEPLPAPVPGVRVVGRVSGRPKVTPSRVPRPSRILDGPSQPSQPGFRARRPSEVPSLIPVKIPTGPSLVAVPRGRSPRPSPPPTLPGRGPRVTFPSPLPGPPSQPTRIIPPRIPTILTPPSSPPASPPSPSPRPPPLGFPPTPPRTAPSPLPGRPPEFPVAPPSRISRGAGGIFDVQGPRGPGQFGFDVLVRIGGRFQRVTRRPLARGRALNLGAELADQTPAATFRIIRNLNQRIRRTGDVPFTRAFRFRRPVKGSRLPADVFIERNIFRIDKPGERRGITLKGLRALAAKRVGSIIPRIII